MRNEKENFELNIYSTIIEDHRNKRNSIWKEKHKSNKKEELRVNYIKQKKEIQKDEQKKEDKKNTPIIDKNQNANNIVRINKSKNSKLGSKMIHFSQ